MDGIPTAAGLAARGARYATHSPRGIRITDEGHALLGQMLRDRAQGNIENGTWRGVTGAHPGPPPQPGMSAKGKS